eukprot:687167-Pelagomonas_calceolata.AAC.4
MQDTPKQILRGVQGQGGSYRTNSTCAQSVHDAASVWKAALGVQPACHKLATSCTHSRRTWQHALIQIDVASVWKAVLGMQPACQKQQPIQTRATSYLFLI